MRRHSHLFHLPVFVLLILAVPLSLLASNDTKVYTLRKSPLTIKVDGFIDEAWKGADSVTDFIQYQPYCGKVPTRRTLAKLLTTEDALYCLILCWDDPAGIQRQAGTLDQSQGDIASLMLDTFGDRRTAYKFAVSASGVRSDCRLLDDARNRDYTWDGVWFAASHLYDWGFAIEMEIPYRSIQYDENLAQWGLDFDRWIPGKTEDIYWCAYQENEGQRISKFGSLFFQDFRPDVKGLNFEVYPVGIAKTSYVREGTYSVRPNAGVDIFYNPSQKLTFQLTANPDFAQIEADPYEFNISRYESYFSERRPFFTEGNEVFMASGRDRNSGFYRPLELFYSRRIGRKLPDGSEVPLVFGTRAFGRINDLEYGGFLAATGQTDYTLDGEAMTEPAAVFGSGRIKKQILGNSSVGLLFVGKRSAEDDNGLLDLDGAFRTSDGQLSYQLARSFRKGTGDFAGSAGLNIFKEGLFAAARGRYVGENFDVQQVGYVPWRGTWELTSLVGPRWYYPEGAIRQILLYGGGGFSYEKVDDFTDYYGILGFNMGFRANLGYEINFTYGKAKDLEKEYNSFEVSFGSWFSSPAWNANLNAGYSKTYNFSRDYLGFYTYGSIYVDWLANHILTLGTSLNTYLEGDPDNRIEDITFNARPYLSLTPVNDFNMRVYVDNLYIKSSEKLEQVIAGFLFSYNFLPKSWIYLAINEVRDRSQEIDAFGNSLPPRLHVANRVGVLKIKYLYYF